MKESLEIKTAKARKSIVTQIEKAVRAELSIFKDEEYTIGRDDYEHYSNIEIRNGSYLFTIPELECIKQAFDRFYSKYGIRYMTMSIRATQTYTPSLRLPVSTPYICISVNEKSFFPI